MTLNCPLRGHQPCPKSECAWWVTWKVNDIEYASCVMPALALTINHNINLQVLPDAKQVPQHVEGIMTEGSPCPRCGKAKLEWVLTDGEGSALVCKQCALSITVEQVRKNNMKFTQQ